jgi:hypothetical protein
LVSSKFNNQQKQNSAQTTPTHSAKYAKGVEDAWNMRTIEIRPVLSRRDAGDGLCVRRERLPRILQLFAQVVTLKLGMLKEITESSSKTARRV